MLRRGILTALNIMSIRLDGPLGLTPDVAIFLDELGEEPPGGEITRHINLDKYLARAAGASADTDGWYRELLGDQGCYLSGDCLYDRAPTAGFLDCECILEKLHGTSGCLALDSESSQGILPLRSETDVAKDRNASGSDLADARCHFLSALDLDALDTALLDEANGRSQCLLRGDLISAHGQVANLAKSLALYQGSVGGVSSYSECRLGGT